MPGAVLVSRVDEDAGVEKDHRVSAFNWSQFTVKRNRLWSMALNAWALVHLRLGTLRPRISPSSKRHSTWSPGFKPAALETSAGRVVCLCSPMAVVFTEQGCHTRFAKTTKTPFQKPLSGGRKFFEAGSDVGGGPVDRGGAESEAGAGYAALSSRVLSESDDDRFFREIHLSARPTLPVSRNCLLEVGRSKCSIQSAPRAPRASSMS